MNTPYLAGLFGEPGGSCKHNSELFVRRAATAVLKRDACAFPWCALLDCFHCVTSTKGHDFCGVVTNRNIEVSGTDCKSSIRQVLDGRINGEDIGLFEREKNFHTNVVCCISQHTTQLINSFIPRGLGYSKVKRQNTSIA